MMNAKCEWCQREMSGRFALPKVALADSDEPWQVCGDCCARVSGRLWQVAPGLLRQYTEEVRREVLGLKDERELAH
jgi:hypothetical protein